MSEDLSSSDRQKIEGIEEQNPICKYMKHVKLNNFKVGDYLIAYNPWMPRDDKAKKPQTAGVVSAVKKFKVIHVNEYGVAFYKGVGLNGKMGEGIKCVDHETYLEVDPDYTESIILGHEYEPYPGLKDKKKLRKKKLEVIKANGIYLKDTAHAVEFAKTLKVGDIWYSGRGAENLLSSNDWHETVEIVALPVFEKVRVGWGSDQTHEMQFKVLANELDADGSVRRRATNLAVYHWRNRFHTQVKPENDETL